MAAVQPGRLGDPVEPPSGEHELTPDRKEHLALEGRIPVEVRHQVVRDEGAIVDQGVAGEEVAQTGWGKDHRACGGEIRGRVVDAAGIPVPGTPLFVTSTVLPAAAALSPHGTASTPPERLLFTDAAGCGKHLEAGAKRA